MNSRPAAAREPESRLGVLMNWLALAALLGLCILAAPAHEAVSVPPGAVPAAPAP